MEFIVVDSREILEACEQRSDSRVTSGKILVASWVKLFAEETNKAKVGVKAVAQLAKGLPYSMKTWV